MRYVWDLAKSDETFRRRDLDFLFATLVFGGPTLVRVDARRDYGETRLVAVGLADGLFLTVVYTERVEADAPVRRIISVRRSNQRERRAHEKAYPPSEA